MEWVEQLVTITGWEGETAETDWSDTEEFLGTPLPDDFKELRRRFAPWGAFSDHLLILKATDGSETVRNNHAKLLKSVTADPEILDMFKPFGLLGANGNGPGTGLVQWGFSLIEEEYYWLADTARDPATWPVIARVDPLEPFQRFDTSASEFVYRVLTETEFEPFGVAEAIPSPYFRTY
ncbi:hypothetical protein E6R60_30860 [Streptomyces sp. A0642]|uniref:hypothetical protein n=1 Tax=Streptomyces sp. A0642 TaxID=2563100 RepID=UPI0010A26604|nr:hypothetical protein [Streptomyces sp. A0642]THA69390.1 hypothetical protein E6R60_30860 [Streptomyces sp. A0642]